MINSNIAGLWNSLPDAERHRLHPVLIDGQRRHLIQAREIAVRNHKRFLKEIDAIIKNCEDDLAKAHKESTE